MVIYPTYPAILQTNPQPHIQAIWPPLNTTMSNKRHPPSVLDRKLGELSGKAGDWMKVDDGWQILRYNTVENAIEVFGDYNPMYAGKPKKLAMWLLEAAAGRRQYVWMLMCSGLAYMTPTLIGVRKRGIRTSFVGLELLDHWAEKYPKFKPFVVAFVTEKARRRIKADCADLSFGALPKEWEDAEVLNKVYLQKAQERARVKHEKDLRRWQYQQLQNQQVYGHNQAQQAAMQQQIITGTRLWK